MKLLNLIKSNVLIDSHCHLNTDNFNDDRDSIVKKAKESGVEKIIDIATDLKSSRKSITISRKYKDVIYSSIGIHPEMYVPGSDLYTENYNFENDFTELEKMLTENPDEIVMIGETGLDYYWLNKMSNQLIEVGSQFSTNSQPTVSDVRQVTQNSIYQQQSLFEEHIKLAVKHDLPLSIHSRDAVDDCIKLVKKYSCTGIFHSLTNESSTSLRLTINEEEKKFYSQVSEILEMGFFIGINGIITYKSAEIMRSVFKKIFNEKYRLKAETLNPLGDDDEFLNLLYKTGFILETDSPFLVPANFHPSQSRRNEPASIKYILEHLKNIFNQ